MASTQIWTNHYGITNMPTSNDTGIDFSRIEAEGFRYTGRDNEGAFCFVGRREAIRCLADVHGNGDFQVRNQDKCYSVRIGGVTRFVIHGGMMIPRPLGYMQGVPVGRWS